jgi:hypothetical protein
MEHGELRNYAPPAVTYRRALERLAPAAVLHAPTYWDVADWPALLGLA